MNTFWFEQKDSVSMLPSEFRTSAFFSRAFPCLLWTGFPVRALWEGIFSSNIDTYY